MSRQHKIPKLRLFPQDSATIPVKFPLAGYPSCAATIVKVFLPQMQLSPPGAGGRFRRHGDSHTCAACLVINYARL
jgi:hypothetical protein